MIFSTAQTGSAKAGKSTSFSKGRRPPTGGQAYHVLARAFKDVFPRYKTMRGYHVVSRRGGWDTRFAGGNRG